MVQPSASAAIGKIDVVFPVLHGPFGEDGTVQGLLKLANLPFVGAGVLGSAVGMDKDVMKRLLRDARIPIAKFAAFQRASKSDPFRQAKTATRLAAVRQTRQPGLVRRHQQSQQTKSIRARRRRGFSLR